MTTTGYIIMFLSIAISGYVMFVLGMRHGSKAVYLELTKVMDTDRADIKKRLNIRYGHESRREYKPWRLDGHGRESKPVLQYIFEKHDEAAHTLTILSESASKYGSVSLADYYDLVKLDSNYTHNNYGWKESNVLLARIVPARSRDGYVIEFPPLEVL